MNKLRFLPFVCFGFLVFGCVIGLCQTPTPVTSPSPAAQTLDYSDSVPYEPRAVIINPRPKNRSKDKKITEIEPAKPSGGSPGNAIRTGEPFTFPVLLFDQEDFIIFGAAKPNFRVFIGDEEQEIMDVVTTTRPLNVVLMLDLSPSAFYREKTIKKIASEIAQKLRPNDKIMVVQFDENLKVLTDFTRDRKMIIQAIEKSKGGDGTSLYDSIEELFDKRLGTIDGPSSIVLITDGVDTTSKRSGYLRSLGEAEKSNANIFPIFFDTTKDPKVLGSNSSAIQGVLAAILSTSPNAPTEKELREAQERGIAYLNDLVRLSGGRPNLVTSPTSKKLPISTLVAGWLTNQYFITIRPKIPPITVGRLPFRVRVNRPGLAVLTRGSYYLGN